MPCRVRVVADEAEPLDVLGDRVETLAGGRMRFVNQQHHCASKTLLRVRNPRRARPMTRHDVLDTQNVEPVGLENRIAFGGPQQLTVAVHSGLAVSGDPEIGHVLGRHQAR